MRLTSWFCTSYAVGPLIVIRKRAMWMKVTQSRPPLHVPPSINHGSDVAAYPAGSAEAIAQVAPATQDFYRGFPELGPGFVSIIVASVTFSYCFQEAHIVLQPTTSAVLEAGRATLAAAPCLLTGNDYGALMTDGYFDGIRPPYTASGPSEEVHQVVDEYFHAAGPNVIEPDSHSAAVLVEVSQYSWAPVQQK